MINSVIHNIAGLVVLFNPDQGVLSNIDSYLNQMNYLFIIDNAEVINADLKAKLDSLENAEYITERLYMGITKALNIDAQKSMENGFDYLLLWIRKVLRYRVW